MNPLNHTQILAYMTRIDDLSLELSKAKDELEDLFDQIEIANMLEDNYEMLIILG